MYPTRWRITAAAAALGAALFTTSGLAQAAENSVQARKFWGIALYDRAGNLVYEEVGICANPAEYRLVYNLPREANDKAYSYILDSKCGTLKLFEHSNGGGYGETLYNGNSSLSSRIAGEGSSIVAYSG